MTAGCPANRFRDGSDRRGTQSYWDGHTVSSPDHHYIQVLTRQVNTTCMASVIVEPSGRTRSPMRRKTPQAGESGPLHPFRDSA